MKLPIMTLLLAMMLLAGCGSPAVRMGSAVDEMERQFSPSENTAGPASINPTESTAALLSKEQAQAIALSHAGLSADQVTGLRTEYEIDDGIPRFEVTFRQGPWEYDYEINASTGAVLSFDRDD